MHRDSDTVRERNVLTLTEARQASPRRMNLRVLAISLVALAMLGLGLTSVFWPTTSDETVAAPAAATSDGAALESSDTPPPAPSATEPEAHANP